MFIDNNKLQDLIRSDEDFLNLLIHSVHNPVINGVRFPGFPMAGDQVNRVGSSNDVALRAVFSFYKAMKEYCGMYHPLRPESRILDFGCGWGRIARFFLRDVNSDNIIGVDASHKVINFCKDNMHFGRWYAINPVPPSGMPEENFDLIFAHSVFSHLEENAARAWIMEFARILNPGGLLIVTTWGRSFLDRCESMRGQEHKLNHYKFWSQAFIPVEKAKKAYDEGMFLFEPTPIEGGELDKSYFGLALIPKKYVEKEYTRYLKLLDFENEKIKDPQAVFVMQKP